MADDQFTTTACPSCSKQFLVAPCRLRRNGKSYCSADCRNAARRNAQQALRPRASTTCQACGAQIATQQSRLGRTKYCSADCLAQSRRLKQPDVSTVLVMYKTGLTYVEIADALGTDYGNVFKAIRRAGEAGRAYGERNGRGEESRVWKGDNASYSAFHRRLYRTKGKAAGCSACGQANTALYYDWANLTGNYADVNDYASLCRPCHRRYDQARESGNTKTQEAYRQALLGIRPDTGPVITESARRRIQQDRESGLLLRELAVRYGLNLADVHNLCRITPEMIERAQAKGEK